MKMTKYIILQFRAHHIFRKIYAVSCTQTSLNTH